jgi:hypothetical protein
MNFLTNSWFILFTVINICALIYLAIKYYCKDKNEPTLIEKLRTAGIFPTIRKPPKASDLKEDDTSHNQINNP